MKVLGSYRMKNGFIIDGPRTQKFVVSSYNLTSGVGACAHTCVAAVFLQCSCVSGSFWNASPCASHPHSDTMVLLRISSPCEITTSEANVVKAACFRVQTFVMFSRWAFSLAFWSDYLTFKLRVEELSSSNTTFCILEGEWKLSFLTGSNSGECSFNA